jgi:hypothetical protein
MLLMAAAVVLAEAEMVMLVVLTDSEAYRN